MNKKQDLKIKLSKEKREAMIHKVKKYFLEEREEELGDLGASLLLDFIIKELGPEFYNEGVYDTYVFMSDRVEDMMGLQK